MDIGAYAKINDLSTILDSTGINIPHILFSLMKKFYRHAFLIEMGWK